MWSLSKFCHVASETLQQGFRYLPEQYLSKVAVDRPRLVLLHGAVRALAVCLVGILDLKKRRALNPDLSELATAALGALRDRGELDVDAEAILVAELGLRQS